MPRSTVKPTNRDYQTAIVMVMDCMWIPKLPVGTHDRLSKESLIWLCGFLNIPIDKNQVEYIYSELIKWDLEYIPELKDELVIYIRAKSQIKLGVNVPKQYQNCGEWIDLILGSLSGRYKLRSANRNPLESGEITVSIEKPFITDEVISQLSELKQIVIDNPNDEDLEELNTDTQGY